MKAMSRPWSEWAADPAAIERIRLRAWIVSMVAPHTPVEPPFVKRQGPMPHSLQHIPAEPILQATISSARLKAVPRPSSPARSSICRAAGSVVCSSMLLFFGILYRSWCVPGCKIPIPGQGQPSRCAWETSCEKLTDCLTPS